VLRVIVSESRPLDRCVLELQVVDEQADVDLGDRPGCPIAEHIAPRVDARLSPGYRSISSDISAIAGCGRSAYFQYFFSNAACREAPPSGVRYSFSTFML
jgi:hypothetical protein